jgi:similar to stage IV sporulation protein
VHGILATIHVIPLVILPRSPLTPKLVASHGGKITSVLVFMGDPEVAPGETVHKGQVLISGVVSAPVPLQPDSSKNPVTDAVKTPAKGQVFADVRYVQTGLQPYKIQMWEPTGKSFSQEFVRFGEDPPLLLKGYGAIPFHDYRSQKFVTQLKWRDVNLPVERVKIVYNGLQRRSQTLSRKQALVRAAAEVAQRMHKAVHEGVRVRERRITRWTHQGFSVQLIWIVNQNIAVPLR